MGRVGKNRKMPPRVTDGPAAEIELPAPTGPSESRWDCSGGQGYTSRGAERQFAEACVGLVRQAMGCPSGWTFHHPLGRDNPRTSMYAPDSSRASPNQRLLWLTWLYGAALRDGTVEQVSLARDLLAEHYDLQATTEGHMMSEVLTTSHYPQWLTAVMCGRFLAWHYDEPVILDRTGKWVRGEFGLGNLLLVDGHPTSPGARPSGRTRGLRTVFNATLRGRRAPGTEKRREWLFTAPQRAGTPNRPIVGNPNNATGVFWRDVVHAGAWCARELLRAGDDFGGAAGPNHLTEIPVLRNRLEVYTKANGDYLFLFPEAGPKVGPHFMFWSARVNGEQIDSSIRRGAIKQKIRNPFPPPAGFIGEPGVRLVVVPGVNG